jgi:hypothetical protein
MAGQAATEAVVQPLAELSDEQHLANIEAIMSSPEMQTAIRSMSRALAEGMVEGTFGPEAQARIGRLITESEGLEPVVASVMRTVVATAMEEMLSPKRREIMISTAGSLSGAMTSAMMAELGEGLREDVAPALAEAMRQHIAPALASAMRDEIGPVLIERLQDPELRAAAGTLMHDVAFGIVMGTNAGVAELTTRAPAAEGGFLQALGRNITVGWAALVAFVVALSIVLIVMIVPLARGTKQRRHLETDTRRREDMLISLIQATAARDMSPAERREVLDRVGVGREGEAAEQPGPDLRGGLTLRET